MTASAEEEQANPIKAATNEQVDQGARRHRLVGKDSETPNCKKKIKKDQTKTDRLMHNYTVGEEKQRSLRKDTVPRGAAFGFGSYNWERRISSQS